MKVSGRVHLLTGCCCCCCCPVLVLRLQCGYVQCCFGDLFVFLSRGIRTNTKLCAVSGCSSWTFLGRDTCRRMAFMSSTYEIIMQIDFNICVCALHFLSSFFSSAITLTIFTAVCAFFLFYSFIVDFKFYRRVGDFNVATSTNPNHKRANLGKWGTSTLIWNIFSSFFFLRWETLNFFLLFFLLRCLASCHQLSIFLTYEHVGWLNCLRVFWIITFK